jgi:hypothetical protein
MTNIDEDEVVEQREAWFRGYDAEKSTNDRSVADAA